MSEYQREGLRATAEPSHNPVAARVNVVTAALRPEGPLPVAAGGDGRGVVKAKDLLVYKGSCDEKTIARMMDRLTEGVADGRRCNGTRGARGGTHANRLAFIALGVPLEPIWLGVTCSDER